MEVREIKTYEELDDVLPLMDKLHATDSEYWGMFSKTGFYAWLISLFPTQCNIWVGYDDDGVAVGYLLAGIIIKYGVREAVVYEAYNLGDSTLTEDCWESVFVWARNNRCKLISCYTSREKVMARKYKFKSIKSYMTLEL
jgi:hypothetical protein